MHNLNSQVSALFVRRNSIYKTLLSDCWDIERNALKFQGSNPVICHPPCRAWGQLRTFAKPRDYEKNTALFCIDVIRENGGILEHPIASQLFKKYLPLPGLIDEFGGYSISVNQNWWGHKAEKMSLFYICGLPLKNLPLIPLSFDAITHVVARCSGYNEPMFKKKELSRPAREATPVDLAKWLIDVASKCKPANNEIKSNLFIESLLNQ